MDNLMIVKVKYGNGGATLSTDRFTYELADGTMVRDTKRISRNYSDNSILDTVERYLTEVRGMNVVGQDGWGRDMGFIVVDATDNNFKSVSGRHEKRLEEVA